MQTDKKNRIVTPVKPGKDQGGVANEQKGRNMVESSAGWCATRTDISVDGVEGFGIQAGDKYGLVTTKITVDVDKYPALLLNVRQATGFYTIKVENLTDKGNFVQLLRTQEPGKYTLKLPFTGGKKDIQITIFVAAGKLIKIEELKAIAREGKARFKLKGYYQRVIKEGIASLEKRVAATAAEKQPSFHLEAKYYRKLAAFLNDKDALRKVENILKQLTPPTTGKPEFYQQKNLSFLTNDKIGLVFLNKDGRITLESVYNFKTDHDFITKPVQDDKTGLWQFTLKTADASSPVNMGDFKTADIRYDNGTVVITHRRLKGNPDATVAIEVSLEKESSFSEWKIKIDGLKASSLGTVLFPVIPCLGNTAGTKDYLFMPRGHGKLVQEPVSNSFANSSTYPSPMMMQHFAYYNGKSALYLATHDGGGYYKKYSWQTIGKNMSFNLENYPPCVGDVKTYQTSYPFVLGVFEGDWFDACKIYRTWATRQYWCANGKLIHGAENTLRDVDLWIWDTKGESTWKLMDDYRKRFKDYRLVFFTHQWRKDAFDINYPVWEAKNPEGFKKFIRNMKSSGIRVAAYFNVRLWQMGTESWKKYNGELYAKRDENGKIRIERCKGNDNATPCAGTKFWQNYQADAIKRVYQELGIGGAYLDQLGTSWPKLCHDKTHGHSFEANNHNKGQRLIGINIKKAMRALDPGFFTITESCTETHLDHRDAVFLVYIKYAHDYSHWVPAYQAVYHDYDVATGTCPMLSQPQFCLLQAIAFSQGNQPFLNTANREKGGNAKHSEKEIDHKLSFLKNLTSHYRQFGEFVRYGEMLRSPAVKVRKTDQDWEWYTKESVVPDVATVVSSAWKAEDGKIAIFLINHTPKKENFQVTINLKDYGFEAKKYKVRKVYRGKKQELSEAQGSYQYEGSLEGHEVLVLELY